MASSWMKKSSPATASGDMCLLQADMTTPSSQPPSALPPDLDALNRLDSAELAAIVEDEMSAGDVTRLQWLLEENADNALTSSEKAELAARINAAEHFARRRDYAAAILARRHPGSGD